MEEFKKKKNSKLLRKTSRKIYIQLLKIIKIIITDESDVIIINVIRIDAFIIHAFKVK